MAGRTKRPEPPRPGGEHSSKSKSTAEQDNTEWSERQPVGFGEDEGNNNSTSRTEGRERRQKGQDASGMRLDEVFPSRRGRGGKV